MYMYSSYGTHHVPNSAPNKVSAHRSRLDLLSPVSVHSVRDTRQQEHVRMPKRVAEHQLTKDGGDAASDEEGQVCTLFSECERSTDGVGRSTGCARYWTSVSRSGKARQLLIECLEFEGCPRGRVWPARLLLRLCCLLKHRQRLLLLLKLYVPVPLCTTAY